MGFWKNRPLIIAVICSILLFVLLLSTSGSTQSSGAGSAMSRLLVPVQRFLYSSTESIGDFFAGLSEDRSIKDLCSCHLRCVEQDHVYLRIVHAD